MTKTITAAGTEYILATITAKTGKMISFSEEDGTALSSKEFNSRLVAASAIAGGADPATISKVVDDIPLFIDGAYGKVLDAAMEVNGLKAAGEEAAGASPASTGDTSTANSL